jgi:hypothetical protein
MDSFILTQRQKVNYASYHRYYSPAPLGGPQATEQGTYNASESKAMCTQVQRASGSSLVRSTLRLDLSHSRSSFGSRKCDTEVTNTGRDPSGLH